MNYNDSFPSATQTDLFEEGEFIEYIEASKEQRFVNFLIDSIFVRLAVNYAVGFLLSRFLLAVSPQSAYFLFGEESPMWPLYLIGIINFLAYYTTCEYFFKGTSLGKLVSGTKVIREDGEALTFKDAFLRSLSRLVPFEALSIWFGEGLWHDVWTKTKVIKTR